MSRPDAPSSLPGGVAEAAFEAWGQAGHFTRWPVEGSSMRPMLQDGDTVIVAHGVRTFYPGDILLYRAGDRLVLHRLLRYQARDRLLLAGDAHRHTDPAIPLRAVIGRAVAIDAVGFECSLVTHTARLAGRVLAASQPLRQYRGLRRAAAVLAWVAARVVRRRCSAVGPA